MTLVRRQEVRSELKQIDYVIKKKKKGKERQKEKRKQEQGKQENQRGEESN